jgi:phosphate-selective porin
MAQTPSPSLSNDALAQKVQELERSLAELKAQLNSHSAVQPAAAVAPAMAQAAPVAAPVSSAVPVDAPAPVADSDSESHTLGPLQLRGFSDFSYGRPFFDNQPPEGLAHSPRSFVLGDFDLFVNAKISPKLNVLGELLVTSDFTNEFAAEMDRLMMTYTVNDYLKITAGKFNTAIGFYTNAFHRAPFFQTAANRPILFTDEDAGGILPVHSVGVSLTGKIPSGALGLHWVAEATNGTAFSQTGNSAVQNFVDENNGKAMNFAVYARPEAVNGLQIGASYYRDKIYPADTGGFDQRIYSAYVALVRSHVEVIGEGVLLQHRTIGGGATYNTPSAYVQVSHAFGIVRPFVRYEYQNVPVSDPVFGRLGRENGPTAGVRFDLADYLALKMQFGRLMTSLGQSATVAQAQVAFAF